MADQKLTMVEQILDALFMAKKATEFMPELPRRMKPSHIRVLHAIYNNQTENGYVRVTDVSTTLRITKPSITKLLNELVELGAIHKTVSATDKRVAQVRLSAFGTECIQKYILDYHGELAVAFGKLDEAKCRELIETVAYIYQSMKDLTEAKL